MSRSLFREVKADYRLLAKLIGTISDAAPLALRTPVNRQHNRSSGAPAQGQTQVVRRRAFRLRAFGVCAALAGADRRGNRKLDLLKLLKFDSDRILVHRGVQGEHDNGQDVPHDSCSQPARIIG